MFRKTTLSLRAPAFTIVVSLLIFLAVAESAADQKNGSMIYQQLQQYQITDSYMIDLVEETAQNLVHAANKWSSGVQVNGPYKEGYVNIYLIDSVRLPEKGNILQTLGINLSKNAVQGGALCAEESKTIFLDIQLLKEFLSYTFLVYYQSINGVEAAARLRVDGIGEFQHLWDPKRNTRLSSRAYREKWLIAFRGMLGFVIGHEVGHIAVGPHDFDFDEPESFPSKRQKDTRWACPDLLDQDHLLKQELERKVDDYCMGLLIQFIIPDNQKPQRLLYEIGAHSYFSFMLNKALVEALFATSSPNIHRMMQVKLGNRLYTQLKALDRARDQGSVQVFYPRSHPATIQRIQQSLNLLTQSPFSAYYGENFGVEFDLMMLNHLRQQECIRLKEQL